jgi:tetratricopeptide (TPR) repeat protein
MELNGYGRQLLREKKIDEAMKIFEYNLKQHPEHWVVYAGMARGYEAKGDMKKAIENMKIALYKAPDNSKPGIQGTIKQWESK